MQALIDYLKTLSVAPGKAYDQSETAYIAPDLIVKNINGTLQAESTTLVKPRIIFRKSYYESLVGELDQSVSDYLKKKKKQYQTLVAELAQRQKYDRASWSRDLSASARIFYGPDHPLKPMLLRDVAQKLQLHESTVSRAVNGKYLQTDFGIFELRSFFSQAINTDQAGNETSVDEVYKKSRLILKLKINISHFQIKN